MRRYESVADHAIGSALSARADETAGAVLARLAREKPACAELVLVVDANGRLEGAVPTFKLFSLEAAEPIARVLDRDFPQTRPETDQERAATLALHHRVDALPVVDERRRPVGVVPAQALLQVLRREHVEDLHRLAGIQRESAQARHAIEDPPSRRVRHRLPWLLFGLAGSAAATAAMASMEGTLRANVAVAFFVPALVYLADAIGTQTETVAVRGLSLTKAGLVPLLAEEIGTGLAVGTVLATLSWPAIWIWFGDARLASAVAVSIVVTGTTASVLGLLFPWALHALRFDPAYGSGPASTVVQDVCTILVYFAVLRAFGL